MPCSWIRRASAAYSPTSAGFGPRGWILSSACALRLSKPTSSCVHPARLSPEMVEDGLTGLLVPPRDAAALAAAIVRLLRDHPLADMLARAGHDLVHERFCVEIMMRSIEALYDLADDGQQARRSTA